MKILIACFLSIAGFLGSEAAVAQTQIVFLTNPGGITVKDVVVKDNGWVLLTFVEHFSQLNSCPSITWGAAFYPNAVWINSAFTGAKQLHLTALSASLTGRKVQIATVDVANPCVLWALGLAPQ